MEKDIIILGIETSCDETACAVVKNGREVLSNVINTQIEIHKQFGGVVPEVASRNHLLKIDEVVDSALKESGLTFKDITAIAVTYGAGLVGALLVGVSYAKGLSYALNLPLIKVNHIHGHICANYVANKQLQPPYMCLVASGGHTAVVRVDDYLNHTMLGGTVDDAVGEAFDKVARVLGLSYPGGPNVDRQSKLGKNVIDFRIKFNENDDYNVSYSGLKTAVINYIHNEKQKGNEINIPDVCLSFQKSAINVLVEKCIRACKQYGLPKLAIAGGVSANSYLRETLTQRCKDEHIDLTLPPLELCADNAVMIASRAYYSYINGRDVADITLNACPNVRI